MDGSAPTTSLLDRTLSEATKDGSTVSSDGAPLRRLTVRALFSQVPTASNLIEVPSEASYTNNAAPQGGPTSPIGHGEAELKQESSMTFSLSSFPVVTIAHFIKASRQILSDAPMLKSHVDRRLLHGRFLQRGSVAPPGQECLGAGEAP